MYIIAKFYYRHLEHVPYGTHYFDGCDWLETDMYAKPFDLWNASRIVNALNSMRNPGDGVVFAVQPVSQ